MLVKFVLLFAAVLIKCIVYVSPHLEFACHKFQQITLILKPITSNISPKIPLEGSNTGSHYLNMHSVIREIITCSDSDFSHFKHKNKVFNLYRFYLLFSPCAPFFFLHAKFYPLPKTSGKKKKEIVEKKKEKKKERRPFPQNWKSENRRGGEKKGDTPVVTWGYLGYCLAHR